MTIESKVAGGTIATTDKGLITAVIATLNVTDADGDWTLPGAFKDGTDVVISAYGHGSWGAGTDALPVGKGVIRATSTQAVVEAQLFLDTPAGAATFAVLKQLGPLGQWSYGYKVLASDFGDAPDGSGRVRFLRDLDVFEASPVLRGAGIGTRTLDAKHAAELANLKLRFVLARVRDSNGRALAMGRTR